MLHNNPNLLISYRRACFLEDIMPWKTLRGLESFIYSNHEWSLSFGSISLFFKSACRTFERKCMDFQLQTGMK